MEFLTRVLFLFVFSWTVRGDETFDTISVSLARLLSKSQTWPGPPFSNLQVVLLDHGQCYVHSALLFLGSSSPNRGKSADDLAVHFPKVPFRYYKSRHDGRCQCRPSLETWL